MTFTVHKVPTWPRRPRCLWGHRKGYVQIGSLEDRMDNQEFTLVVPNAQRENDGPASD